MARTLFQNLSIVAAHTEEKIYRFVANECGNVTYMKDEQLGYDKLVCFECFREPYLFAQICLRCKHSVTTIILNHLQKEGKTCNIL